MIEFESLLVGGEDRLDAGTRPFVSLALSGGDQRMGPAGLATQGSGLEPVNGRRAYILFKMMRIASASLPTESLCAPDLCNASPSSRSFRTCAF